MYRTPTGTGRFVGLRCNITQYLHVIIDARTSEGNNVFKAWAMQETTRRTPGTGSREKKKKQKQVQSQRRRL